MTAGLIARMFQSPSSFLNRFSWSALSLLGRKLLTDSQRSVVRCDGDALCAARRSGGRIVTVLSGSCNRFYSFVHPFCYEFLAKVFCEPIASVRF